MGLNLLDPVANVVEGVLIGAIVSQDDTMSSFIVGLSDGPEPLLSSGVPHLKLDQLCSDIDGLCLTVKA